jgi:hypothetical protein
MFMKIIMNLEACFFKILSGGTAEVSSLKTTTSFHPKTILPIPATLSLLHRLVSCISLNILLLVTIVRTVQNTTCAP